ncbi:MAG: hypothetical protein WC150_11880 [Bacteroidia bacterium]
MKNLLLFMLLLSAVSVNAQKAKNFVMPQSSTALQFTEADREFAHLDVAISNNFTAYTFNASSFINMPYRNAGMVATLVSGVYVDHAANTVSGSTRANNTYGTTLENGTGQGAKLPDNFIAPNNPLQSNPR